MSGSFRTTHRRHCRLLVAAAALCLLSIRAAVCDESSAVACQQHALTHAGDAERGRRLFEQQTLTRCLSCHKVGGTGGVCGPDLSAIGGKFDRPHLIESLLEPSRQIVEGYRTSTLLLRDGQTLTGVVREQTDSHLVLHDVQAQRHEIPLAEIEQRRTTDVSLMPDGLHRQLTPQDFTDLIAYLETLRPGGKPRYGEGITGPITLAEGWQIHVMATGLDGATALETLPDGRVLVCEQTGALRVIEHDRLLPQPFVKLPVDSSWERGLIGVTIDPGFPEQPYVYVCWVAAQPYPHHRISRFTANCNLAAADSELVLLEGDDQRRLGGKVPAGHQGGAVHFGPDGCLYIAIGEQTAETPAQKLDTFQGKILRMHRDGSIPRDNPFLDQTEGKYQAIWAIGCRNPFTFAIRETDGLMLINDVGGKFEEINVGRAGANFGWPRVDHGPRPADEEFTGPLHWYPQASISGGDFSPLEGDYYFADFVLGWIHALDPQQPDEVREIASGLRRPVDLRFAADGSLYVLLRNAWVIDGKFEGGTGSLLKLTRKAAELQ